MKEQQTFRFIADAMENRVICYHVNRVAIISRLNLDSRLGALVFVKSDLSPEDKIENVKTKHPTCASGTESSYLQKHAFNKRT